jgi:hypothetical protein
VYGWLGKIDEKRRRGEFLSQDEERCGLERCAALELLRPGRTRLQKLKMHCIHVEVVDYQRSIDAQKQGTSPQGDVSRKGARMYDL